MTDTPTLPARYSIFQALRAVASLSMRTFEEVRVLAGKTVRLPPIKEWTDAVHYEGAVVVHLGQCWQARRDTGRAPPHEDWLLIAARGQDARAGEVCGTYDASRDYRQYDLVTLNGSEWRAKHDKPGALPGDGWVLAAQRGSSGGQGHRGERGPPGPAGPAGVAAPAIVGWKVDDFRATPVLSDGKLGPPLDLRPLFEQYHAEARR